MGVNGTQAGRHPRTRRGRLVAVLLALSVGLLVWMTDTGMHTGRLLVVSDQPAVMTVAGLQREIAQAPQAWQGRSVQLRGLVVSVRTRRDPFTWSEQDLLLDSSGPARLPVSIGPEDHILAVLRRLPLVGPLMPPPQTVVWGAVALYRVQLQPGSGRRCRSCGDVLLLDAV